MINRIILLFLILIINTILIIKYEEYVMFYGLIVLTTLLNLAMIIIEYIKTLSMEVIK